MENEDDKGFLEGLKKKIDSTNNQLTSYNDRINKALNFNDHINWRDPLGWETLGQRWGEKTIGKKWREGQMQDIWNAVPEAWRPNIAKAAMSTAEGVGSYWQEARTIDNWFNPFELAETSTIRSLELVSLPLEGLAQLTSAGTGLDIELSRIVADFVPVGGAVNKIKLLRRANIAKKVTSKSSFSPGSLDDLLQKAVKSGNKKEMKRVLDLMDTQDASFIRENQILTSIKNKLDEGSGYSYRKGRPLKNPIWDNLPEKTQKLFIEAGMDSDQARFFIEKWNEKVPRETSAALEGFPFTDRTFEFMSEQMLPNILEDMKGVNLSDGLQVDHIAQLRAMLPFYYKKNLIESAKVRRILIKEGIFGGHHPKNLKYLPTNVHTVKTNFWTDQVGDYGEKFFKGRPMKTDADIQKAAKEMKVFINRSNDIVEKVSAQYKFMRKKNITADELDKILKKVDLNHGTYNLKEVRALIKEIEADKLAKSKKGLDDAKKAAEAVEFKEKKTFLPYEIEDVDPADIPKKPRTKKKKSTLEKMAEKEFLKEHERIKKLKGQQELDLD